MDITVARLNNRLALQLPTELPLGLVFVVGRVKSVSDVHGSGQDDASPPLTQLELSEADHSLRCVLTQRVAAETTLRPGDKVRAGGHLAFDPHQADYYLLVRDLELMEEAQVVPEEIDLPLSQEASASLLQDLDQLPRTSPLPQSEMPDWVRKLAPPEINVDQAPAEPAVRPLPESHDQSLPQAEADSDSGDMVADDVEPDDSDEEIFSILAQAMDSTEDIELDPEKFPELTPAADLIAKSRVTGQPYEVPPTAAPPVAQPRRQPQQADPLMVLLLITFVVVIVTTLVIVAILLLR